jgi:hypothetical protein
VTPKQPMVPRRHMGKIAGKEKFFKHKQNAYFWNALYLRNSKSKSKYVTTKHKMTLNGTKITHGENR